MLKAQWSARGILAECPTTGLQFTTVRVQRVDANHVRVECRWCDASGHPRSSNLFDQTQPARHICELDQVRYDDQEVTA